MDWVLLLAVVAVVLSVATIVLTLKLVKRKKPVWAYWTRRIIGRDTDAPPELQISFQGRPVDNVHQTGFILFNTGAETIQETDVVEPVRIHFGGASILHPPTILAVHKEANKLSVRLIVDDQGDAVEIGFHYLDRGDGIAVEVIHTEAEEMRCSGVVVGTDEIGLVAKLAAEPDPALERLSYVLMGIFGGVVASFAVRQLADPDVAFESRGSIGLFVFMAMLGFLLLGNLVHGVIADGYPIRLPVLSRPIIPSWAQQSRPLRDE